MAAQVGLLEVGDVELETPQLSAGEQQIIAELLAGKSILPRIKYRAKPKA